jgi:hypothetical protein
MNKTSIPGLNQQREPALSRRDNEGSALLTDPQESAPVDQMQLHTPDSSDDERALISKHVNALLLLITAI